jgi:CelD/BcsL family acetyltransferase involved in cellulose biosynthesis
MSHEDAITLESLREEWSALAPSTGSIFSTWEWASIWWRHFGEGHSLRLSVHRAPDGRAVAILPLYLWSRGMVHVLRFVGHGPADELGPVCRPEDRLEAVDRLARTLAGAGSGWHLFLGERLPADIGWSGLLAAKVLRTEANPVCRSPSDGWEGFLRSRSANFREQVRSRERRLSRRHELSYRLADDPARLQEDLDTLFALHRSRWGHDRSSFSRLHAFHREFATCALQRGWLRLWFLELDGRPVAAWHGFRFHGVESYYQAGRDPAWDGSSVGFVLLAHTVREALRDGVSEYRMLRGGESYKYRFATADRPLETVARSRGLLGRAGLAVSGLGEWRPFRAAVIRRLRTS